MTDLLSPDCEGCRSPARGIYRANCRECTLRSLAAGPLFFESLRLGKLSPAYREALRTLGEPSAVHIEVKAIAKQTVKGSIPA
jgi:hypothetical protein